MKHGVKHKHCKYFLLLNLFCGIGFLALFYPVYSNQRTKLNPKLIDNLTNFSSESIKPINSIFLGNVKSNKDTSAAASSPKKPEIVIKILLWTTYFNGHPLNALALRQVDGKFLPDQQDDCPVRCQFTSDRNQSLDADAIVFHSRNIKSDDIPSTHPPDQIWVYMQQESPPNTRHDLKELKFIFNWTMTYRRDSDVYHPYGEVVPKKFPTSTSLKPSKSLRPLQPRVYRKPLQYFNHFQTVQLPQKVLSDAHSRLRNKTKLVAWVVSNCNPQSKREAFVSELRRYIDIDIYGKCGDFKCASSTSKGCFAELDQNYKFYLSLENSLCRDYVTEKFFNALSASLLVPVVYGYANYSQLAPPGSFIDSRDFKTVQHLANYLLHLDAHPEEYLKYFRWKDAYEVRRGSGWCNLCRKLTNRKLLKQQETFYYEAGKEIPGLFRPNTPTPGYLGYLGLFRGIWTIWTIWGI